MTTNHRRAPRAITVIDDIALYNAVAQCLLLLSLLLFGRITPPATVGFIAVGCESCFLFLRSTFPLEPISQYQYHCAIWKLYLFENVFTHNSRDRKYFGADSCQIHPSVLDLQKWQFPVQGSHWEANSRSRHVI